MVRGAHPTLAYYCAWGALRTSLERRLSLNKYQFKDESVARGIDLMKETVSGAHPALPRDASPFEFDSSGYLRICLSLSLVATIRDRHYS